jgi:NADH-quinone oxidoreductase subunit G
MVKVDGRWSDVTWDEGIKAASRALRSVVTAHGADRLGVLMSASAASEEYYLAQRLARGLDCPNIDHRLREQDFSDDAARTQPNAFQSAMSAVDDAGAILLVGSNIRHEAPILGQRVRKAWRRGAQVAALNPVDWDCHFFKAHKIINAPQHMVAELAAIAGALAKLTGNAIPGALQAVCENAQPGELHDQIAGMLNGNDNSMLILGQAAMAHGQAGWLRQLAAWICEASGSALNTIPFGANTTGAALAGALPGHGCGGVDVEQGLNARSMLEASLQGYLLWDVEPGYDIANPALAQEALGAAQEVVAVTSFAGEDLKSCADVILPLAPLAESEGTYHALDGQSFKASQAVRPAGQSRPGWKILRRLGADLELEGFSQVDIAALREEMTAAMATANYTASEAELAASATEGGLYRVGEVPMYSVDALCRRSVYLQQTVHADNDFVGLNPGDADSMGLEEGSDARVSQGDASAVLPVRICPELPAGAAWVKCAVNISSELGDSFGPISVEAS